MPAPVAGIDPHQDTFKVGIVDHICADGQPSRHGHLTNGWGLHPPWTIDTRYVMTMHRYLPLSRSGRPLSLQPGGRDCHPLRRLK